MAHVPLTSRIDDHLRSVDHDTPYLVVDLDVVAERFDALARALPGVELFYAIKANPAREILELLVEMGGSCDVASPGEIDACLAAGVAPEQISYGNTIKKRRDIAYAYARGVRLFAFDSDAELDKLVDLAPGATAFCRITTSGHGADWPLSTKFGAPGHAAVPMLRRAARAGMAVGVSFHVGSQQRDVDAWDDALATTAEILDQLDADGIEPALVNLGGGFPARYLDGIPDISVYGAAIRRSVARHLGGRSLRLLAEPGRYLVGEAGVLESEVVLVAERRPGDRWVYLDVGLFGGLAETMDEAIRYRICTPHDGTEAAPAAIAGPTCDSADVLYEKAAYLLPTRLAAGDRVRLLSTGAYTTTYASVAFNGFRPLTAVHLPRTR